MIVADCPAASTPVQDRVVPVIEALPTVALTAPTVASSMTSDRSSLNVAGWAAV